MALKPEAIVVGAGIAGVMTALHLVRRGASVTLIDRWEPGHSRASSTDYNRVYRCIHGADEFYTKWARDARLRWLELQEEIGWRLYYECGALILATEHHCHWEDATIETFNGVVVVNVASQYALNDITDRFDRQRNLGVYFAQFFIQPFGERVFNQSVHGARNR